MKRNAYLSVACLAATLAYTAPAPYPLPVNSRSQTAPPVTAYAGNLNTYRVTLMDGNEASQIVGTEEPFMAWATNVAALPATGTCYIVAGTTGVFDVVFPPSQVNYAAGRYMYEVGVKSNGIPRTFKHGTFQIIGSPIGSGLGYVNWTTNLNWGSIVWGGLPTITVNGQPFSIATNSTLTVTASGVDDTVARASIAVLETQRVTRVWSADGTQFAETGVVWQASQATNYTVALSSEFIDSGAGERPSWATNVFPFSDRDGIEYDGGSTAEELYILSRYVVRWSAPNLGSFPVMLVGVGEYAQGTAVVSQHISTVYSPVKAYAIQADLIAVSNQGETVKTDLTTHISTNAASVIAQAQPSTLMRYADFATTNTAGFAAFTNLNPAARKISVFQPTVGQSLAKARWDVASTLAGTLSVSAYASSAFSSNAVYAVLTLYTAGGAVVASNIGATVVISRMAVSNISATVTLSAPATNGYVVAEIFSAMAASNYVNVQSGGSYPFALSTLNSPLGYLTLAHATALFALKDSGTQVNPTMAGDVKFEGSLTFGGTTYETMPAVPTAEDISAITKKITKPILSSVTNIVVASTNSVYYVPVTANANISFDFSGLALGGTNRADITAIIDCQTTQALYSVFNTDAIATDCPWEPTVTGRYEFAVSSDGVRTVAGQVWPQTSEWQYGAVGNFAQTVGGATAWVPQLGLLANSETADWVEVHRPIYGPAVIVVTGYATTHDVVAAPTRVTVGISGPDVGAHLRPSGWTSNDVVFANYHFKTPLFAPLYNPTSTKHYEWSIGLDRDSTVASGAIFLQSIRARSANALERAAHNAGAYPSAFRLDY